MGGAVQTIVVYILFMVSGCTSLIFEVVWFQWLELVFGSTTLAISTILVAYMLGLGVGALFAGRISCYLKNGVRTYGIIEISIGLYALVVPAFIALYPGINAVITSSVSFQAASVIRFMLSLAVFLVPTFLMGATLPVLIHALTHNKKQIGHSVATLYGVNTTGAVLGVIVSTFVVLPMVGLQYTNMLASCLSVLTGLLAIFLVAPKYELQGKYQAQTVIQRPVFYGRDRVLLIISFAIAFKIS